MTNHDDYPILRHTASLSPCTNPCQHDHCARWREARRVLDEIDRLRGDYQPVLHYRTLTRLLKARAILAEGDTHPQYRQLVDAIDTALDLDPPSVLQAVQP